MSETVFHSGRVTTLDRTAPEASAIHVRDGTIVAVGTDRDLLGAAPAAALGGMGWIMALTCFNGSAQTAVPDWARGLAVFLTVSFGATAWASSPAPRPCPRPCSPPPSP